MNNSPFHAIIPHSELPAFIISAAASGSGKTVIAVGIMRALAKRGFKVRPFKTGPDYLDGTYHEQATGHASYNLDTWMLDRQVCVSHFHTMMEGYDIGVIEGVMGLYDGFEGTIKGSTAELALLLNIPVVLIIDCKGMSGSVAPLVYGFSHYRTDVTVGGVIFNNTGSQRHVQYLTAAVEPLGIPVFGAVCRTAALAVPHRHLGLVSARHGSSTDQTVDTLATVVEQSVDLDKMMHVLLQSRCPAPLATVRRSSACVCRIAVGYDEAFHFYYRANLDMLELAGVELVFFSPLADVKLPPDINGLYLGGGYPEEHSAKLAQNLSMRASIREFSEQGGCIYAECGGYMYLGAYLETQGRTFPLCGIFETRFQMQENRLKSLGYREITLATDTFLGRAGLKMRGHEFHYSVESVDAQSDFGAPFTVTGRCGGESVRTGRMIRRTIGSYLHIHFLSAPEIAHNFVTACAQGCRSSDYGVRST